MNALDIAKGLESNGEDCTCHASCYYECVCDAVWGESYTLNAAAELRRLHKLNGELLEALKGLYHPQPSVDAFEKARVAMYKATGETK